MELRVLEEEAKNTAVAKEYLANKKKPFYHTEHYYEMSACKFNVKKTPRNRAHKERLREAQRRGIPFPAHQSADIWQLVPLQTSL